MTNTSNAPVSVVIPCYRCASTIQRAVQSVSNQTQKPVEVILVDDASGDNTLAVLHELAQQNSSWIKVITLAENQGAGSARNAGWEMATQPYIAFLDSDDTWIPSKLALQYEIMLNNKDIVLSGHRCLVYRNAQDAAKPYPRGADAFSLVKPIAMLFKNRFSTTSTVMLKRDIPFRFKEGKRYAEDFYLWQQIIFSGYLVAYIDSPLAYVYKPLYGAGGLSANLWQMEKGELNNFYCLYQAKQINLILYGLAAVFSLIKLFKRYLYARLLIR